MRHALATTVLLAVSLAGCFAGPGDVAGDDAPADAPGGALGPAWSMTDTNGTQHTRETALGDPVVLFFMATWCPSCARTARDVLPPVHAEFAPRGVLFLSVAYDDTDDNESLEAWKARYGNDWPHGFDPTYGIHRTFRITSQSSVVVLDDRGHVERTWGYGQATEAALAQTLEGLARP